MGSRRIQGLLAHHSSSVKPQSTHSMPERGTIALLTPVQKANQPGAAIYLCTPICIQSRNPHRHDQMHWPHMNTPQQSHLPGCSLFKAYHSNRPGTDQLPQIFSGSHPAASVSRRRKGRGDSFPCPQLWAPAPMPEPPDSRGRKVGCLRFGGGDSIVEGHAAAIRIDGLASDVAGCV